MCVYRHIYAPRSGRLDSNGPGCQTCARTSKNDPLFREKIINCHNWLHLETWNDRRSSTVLVDFSLRVYEFLNGHYGFANDHESASWRVARKMGEGGLTLERICVVELFFSVGWTVIFSSSFENSESIPKDWCIFYTNCIHFTPGEILFKKIFQYLWKSQQTSRATLVPRPESIIQIRFRWPRLRRLLRSSNVLRCN